MNSFAKAEVVSEQKESPKVTIQSVHKLFRDFNYLVVPASHSNIPGLEGLLGAFFASLCELISYFTSWKQTSNLKPYKDVGICTRFWGKIKQNAASRAKFRWASVSFPIR